MSFLYCAVQYSNAVLIECFKQKMIINCTKGKKWKEFNLILSFTFCISSIAYGLDILDRTPTKVKGTDFNYLRKDDRYPKVGNAMNWKALDYRDVTSRFSPRFGHATCIFKCPEEEESGNCIWLTGGHSEKYQTFDMTISDRNADVWWSKNGASWTKVTKMQGDYVHGLGNWDAKVPGPVAPWYSRHGHSLNALDADNDGIADAIVLAGGNNPVPSNDTWISPDGRNWWFDGYAPWSGRAYHASTVFKGELWILGGAPLSNDVWAGKLVVNTNNRSGFTMDWRLVSAEMQAPWAPRAGSCATTQLRNELMNATTSTYSLNDYMYLIGGLAGFTKGHSRFDNTRTRNDVWITSDGSHWKRIKPPKGRTTMPWVGRAWHGCNTWHHPNDRSIGVGHKSVHEDGLVSYPRIYIAGGGYMGTKGNNVVRRLEGYVDVWWSHDGSNWYRTNYMEGSKSNLYSTSDWSQVTGGVNHQWLGKWGFTIESFYTGIDMNNDGVISSDNVFIEYECSNEDDNNQKSKVFEDLNENIVPTLFVIGGKYSDDGPYSNRVYASQPGGKFNSSIHKSFHTMYILHKLSSL